VASVLASFFGVQKSETRERDFQHGRARDFILVGLLLTALFIFLLWAVVRLVMYLATGSQ
jgi:Na+/melibiose symporter-like transporter